jgi:hypothetical protein
MVAPRAVTDARSSASDQVAHAATAIGGSAARRRVFEAVYRGRKATKSVTEIMAITGLSRKQVLSAAKPLARNQVMHQTKAGKETGYQKDEFYAQHRDKILRLAANPEALSRFPTKVNPRPQERIVVKVNVPSQVVRTRLVTIDDLDSFRKVTTISSPTPGLARSLAERSFKEGIQRIIGEQGEFKDWGGEKNDLHTTRLRIEGMRVLTALALKGPATTGKLTPGKLGTNGDQIQRLFISEARLFLIQYHGEIGESVLEQMAAFARNKSVATGDEILYGVIDGTDSDRIVQAYRSEFNPPSRGRRTDGTH